MRLGQNKSSLSIYLSFMNSIPFEILSEERVNELEDYVDLLISSNLSNFPNDNLLVELQKIKKLKFTRIPKPIPFGTSGCVTKKITTIQNYIQLLSYNYLGEYKSDLIILLRFANTFNNHSLGDPFFIIKKSFSIHKLCRIAQQMVSASLPIKCLEAVVLGIQQTMNLENLDRITLSFKSVCDGIVYRHIVLVLKYFDKWGALGLSRRPDLMNKTLTYRTLSDLIHEYKICYENNFHKLLKVKLGWPVAHNLASNEAPTWKHTCIYIQQPWSDVMKEVDSYCRLLRSR